jgi:hypothetical protein
MAKTRKIRKIIKGGGKKNNQKPEAKKAKEKTMKSKLADAGVKKLAKTWAGKEYEKFVAWLKTPTAEQYETYLKAPSTAKNDLEAELSKSGMPISVKAFKVCKSGFTRKQLCCGKATRFVESVMDAVKPGKKFELVAISYKMPNPRAVEAQSVFSVEMGKVDYFKGCSSDRRSKLLQNITRAEEEVKQKGKGAEAFVKSINAELKSCSDGYLSLAAKFHEKDDVDPVFGSAVCGGSECFGLRQPSKASSRLQAVFSLNAKDKNVLSVCGPTVSSMFPRIEVEPDGSRISPRSGATQNLGMWGSVFDTEARPASEVFFESIRSSKGKGARKPTKKDKDDKDDKDKQGGGGSNNKLYYAVFFSKKI